MSDLSSMKQLLDGVDVEWMALGDIGEFIRGNGMQKKDFSNEGFPAIHYGQIFTRYGLSADKTFTYVPEQLAKKLKKANKNDLLLATTSENDEDVVKPLAWLGEEIAISGDMMLFRHSQNAKYLAYYFQTTVFQKQKKKHISGAKVRRVSKDSLAKMYVPIPSPKDHKRSLEIQTEIVRILDTFSSLTQSLKKELTEELATRQEQYNYYRDQLLSFNDGEFEWKMLGAVSNLITKGTTPKVFSETGINFIKLESFHNNRIRPEKLMYISPLVHEKELKRSRLEENDILFAIAGATIGKCAIVEKNILPANTNQALAIIRLDGSVDTKYVYHFMQTSVMKDYIAKFNKTSAQPNLNLKQMSDFRVPIPFPKDLKKSLAEQKRIASVLDRLEMQIRAINENLPREIELRQKQYEYYRDLLLSFPKSEKAEV
ncbi:restriction endonuclease subunit S [Vibrio harveyi]